MTTPELPMVEVRQRQHDHIASLLELELSTTDQNFHYRWVSLRPRSVGNAKVRGYVFVPVSEGVKTRAGYLDDRADELMCIQDVVLMKCDMNGWLKRKKRETRVNDKRLQAPKKQFKNRARAKKVRILNEEDE